MFGWNVDNGPTSTHHITQKVVVDHDHEDETAPQKFQLSHLVMTTTMTILYGKSE